jgi:hypothetical protein
MNMTLKFPGVVAAARGETSETEEERQERYEEIRKRHQEHNEERATRRRLQLQLYRTSQCAGYTLRIHRRSGEYLLIDPQTNERIKVNGHYFTSATDLLDHLKNQPKVTQNSKTVWRRLSRAGERAGLCVRKDRTTSTFTITNAATGEVCLDREPGSDGLYRWMDRVSAEEVADYLKKQPIVSVDNELPQKRIHRAAKRVGLIGRKNRYIGKFVISDRAGNVLLATKSSRVALKFCKRRLSAGAAHRPI